MFFSEGVQEQKYTRVKAVEGIILSLRAEGLTLREIGDELGLSHKQLLATLKQQGLVDSDIFISQTNALTEQLRAVKLEKERLLDTEQDQAIAATKELMETLDDGPDFLTDFDAELFGELVDKIIVDSNERLRFRLKNGLELTETIARTVR